MVPKGGQGPEGFAESPALSHRRGSNWAETPTPRGLPMPLQRGAALVLGPQCPLRCDTCVQGGV